MIYNFFGSGSGSYSLVPTSTNQPRSTTSNADGNLGEESGRADVPPRPDPPTKPVASDQKPSSVCIKQHLHLLLGN